MIYLDQRLESIAHQSLAVCRSVSDALLDVFARRNQKGGVTLSLQSRYGTLVSLPSQRGARELDLCSHPLLKTLASAENEERIALLLGAEAWNMVSCFSLSGIAFYPVISVPAPPPELRWVRYEMLGALDCFSLKCKESLVSFFDRMTKRPDSPDAAGDRKGKPEKKLLETLAAYSAGVESVALIDNDGFALIAVGHEQKAEAIASSLALFHSQSSRKLDDLGAVAVRSLSLHDDHQMLLVGQVPGSSVSLAFSIHGAASRVTARFLFDAGLAGLRSLSTSEGTLDNYQVQGKESRSRYRTEWLSSLRLEAKGAFAALAGTGVFHDPKCNRLFEGDVDALRWLASRAEAIRSGLVPCDSCNP